MMLSMPDATASSTPYWMIGLSTTGSISLGWALVAGRNRVPSPAAGNTALRTFIVIMAGCQRTVLFVASNELKIVPDCDAWRSNPTLTPIVVLNIQELKWFAEVGGVYVLK